MRSSRMVKQGCSPFPCPPWWIAALPGVVLDGWALWGAAPRSAPPPSSSSPSTRPSCRRSSSTSWAAAPSSRPAWWADGARTAVHPVWRRRPTRLAGPSGVSGRPRAQPGLSGGLAAEPAASRFVCGLHVRGNTRDRASTRPTSSATRATAGRRHARALECPGLRWRCVRMSPVYADAVSAEALPR